MKLDKDEREAIKSIFPSDYDALGIDAQNILIESMLTRESALLRGIKAVFESEGVYELARKTVGYPFSILNKLYKKIQNSYFGNRNYYQGFNRTYYQGYVSNSHNNKSGS